jgi:hypothetical protein
MKNLKVLDKVAIKATGVEGFISCISCKCTAPRRYYLVDKDNEFIYNGEGLIFRIEELDYTKEQKLHFQYEADLHEWEHRRAANEYHYYNL